MITMMRMMSDARTALLALGVGAVHGGMSSLFHSIASDFNDC